MELGSVLHFLQDKTILVTGATGFLAKIFVEKILRVQPNVKRLYLLLRAVDTNSATQRLQNEVIGKELFRVLRDMWGVNFDSFISKKVVAVTGDVFLEDLGIQDANLKEKMLEQIDVIVNCAATTKFDERFDIAMGVNTMGALHVLNFAKICHKVQVLLHTSTAYVCGEAKDEEVIKEHPFQMGQTLKGTTNLDIQAEKNLMEKKVHELQAENALEKTITSTMKGYGIERANLHGWPNTCVFTKAMGEMLLVHLKDSIPLVILRPTMVTSTYKEPFPGWIEGFRTLDSVIGGYGKGKISCFLGHSKTILDAIPADMVINCMMAAIVTHSNQTSKNFIYHIGSSLRNPLRISYLHDISYRYFTKNPCTEKSGKPIIISKGTLLTSMATFKRFMMIRYVIPIKGLNLVNKVFCQCYQDFYSDSRRKIKMIMRMVELYKPYVFFKAVFDDTNTENLRIAINDHFEMKGAGFEFDPRCINWTDYLMNTHIPGLLEHALQ